jgi:hypothetical protein
MHWDWDPCIHNFFPLQGAKRTFCCLASAQAWKGTGRANTTCRVIEANATLERQHASGCIKRGGIEPQLQNLIWYPKKRHEQQENQLQKFKTQFVGSMLNLGRAHL